MTEALEPRVLLRSKRVLCRGISKNGEWILPPTVKEPAMVETYSDGVIKVNCLRLYEGKCTIAQQFPTSLGWGQEGDCPYLRRED